MIETNKTDGPAAKRTPNEDALLAGLHPEDRRLVLDVVAQHPGLTVSEAVERLNAAGM
jgi:hypothetical protein